MDNNLKNTKKNELLSLLEEMNLSSRKFICKYYDSLPDYLTDSADQERDIERFYDRFKKQIRANTTKESIYGSYLKFLYTLPEFEALGKFYIPSYFDLMSDEELLKDGIDDDFKKQMTKISKSIDFSISRKKISK